MNEGSTGPTVLEEMAATAEAALKLVMAGAGVVAGLGIVVLSSVPTMGGTRSLRIEREARQKLVDEAVSRAEVAAPFDRR